MARGVPPQEHEFVGPSASLDWEAIRLYLEVVRCGSFRAAAERLHQSINVLRRRVDGLERQLGVRLLTRHVDGVRTTAEGERILRAAQLMESASFDLVRAREQATHGIAGDVRLAVTEGLGTFWLVPRLTEFQRAFPNLIIDLRCAMQSADVLRMEADLAVQLLRPEAQDLKVVKLGRLHVMPFAARSYIDTYGMPRSIDDWPKHRIVLLVAEQAASLADYQRSFPGVPQSGLVAMRTNVSSAHYWAIAKGAGIGLLPTYAQALGARIVPIDIGIRLPIDIWLTYHQDAKRIPRVERMIGWLVEAFDSRRFPWFGDEFVHPQELAKTYQGEPLVNLFEGFLATNDSCGEVHGDSEH